MKSLPTMRQKIDGTPSLLRWILTINPDGGRNGENKMALCSITIRTADEDHDGGSVFTGNDFAAVLREVFNDASNHCISSATIENLLQLMTRIASLYAIADDAGTYTAVVTDSMSGETFYATAMLSEHEYN